MRNSDELIFDFYRAVSGMKIMKQDGFSLEYIAKVFSVDRVRVMYYIEKFDKIFADESKSGAVNYDRRSIRK